MMQRCRIRHVSWIGGLLLGACATTMKPPASNSGPVLSNDGVQVAVLRQACLQTQPVDEVPTGSVDETVEIQVRNGSPAPLTVRPDRFRLLGSDAVSPATTTSGSGDALTVVQGGAETFALQFSARNGLDCAKEMRLDPTAAITSHDSPVALAPVPFRPL
jgi:hypothetical protein